MASRGGLKRREGGNEREFPHHRKDCRPRREGGDWGRNPHPRRAGEVLSCGVSRAVLGSAAAENPELAEECAAEYGEKIAVGADSENGIIRTSGWTKSGGIGYLEFCRDMARRGVKTLVVTDISRDGMLSGVNLEMLKTLKENVPANLVASGGVSSESDIESLAELGVYGAICGKSLYAGTLDLKRALEIAHAR